MAALSTAGSLDPRRRRRWWAAAVGVLVAAAGLSLSEAGLPRVTVTYETRVTLDLRLFLTGGGDEGASLSQTLQGRAGEKLTLSHTVQTPDGPLVLLLALTADPDQPRERCRVRVVSDARQGVHTARLDRVVFLRAERAALIDLWRRGKGPPHLVLALSAHWTDAPQATALTAGVTPVDFVIETALRVDGQVHVVDERRLSGLVGSPVEFNFRHAPGEGLPGPPAPDEAPDQGVDFLLHVTPELIQNERLEVSAQVTLLTPPTPGAAPAEAPAPDRRDALTKRKLEVGQSAEIVVPLRTDGAALVVKITPFF